jgi:hypothetical protein
LGRFSYVSGCPLLYNAKRKTRITLKFDAAVAWAYVVTGDEIDVTDGECEELL